MIKLTLILGIFLTYAVRWRSGTAGRVKNHRGIWHLIGIDVFVIAVVVAQLLGFGSGTLRLSYEFQYFGLLLFVLGCIFASYARFNLHSDYMPAFDTKSPTNLNTNGPYRIVRHPIYLGSLLTVLGFELALNSVVVFVILLFLFIVINRINKEEELLAKTHQKEWEIFIQKTPFKLIPFVY